MNTISHLTYARILSIAKTPIEQVTQHGTREVSIKDTIVLARVRDLSASLQFFCRDHKIVDQGSFFVIHPAIVEVVSLMKQYGLTPHSDGELRVYLKIHEHSVSLLRPDQYSFRSIPFDDRDDTHRLIKQLPDHGPNDREELIWSSHWTEDRQTQTVQIAREQFESQGRIPGECLDEIRSMFDSLTTTIRTPQTS